MQRHTGCHTVYLPYLQLPGFPDVQVHFLLIIRARERQYSHLLDGELSIPVMVEVVEEGLDQQLLRIRQGRRSVVVLVVIVAHFVVRNLQSSLAQKEERGWFTCRPAKKQESCHL